MCPVTRSLPVVAIVGRPNVGKSSIANALAKRRVSIVEPTPGVTRDSVVVTVTHAGRTFELMDTGGIGMEDGTPIGTAVQRQIEAGIGEADLILFVTSIDRPFSETERQFLSYISDQWHKNIVVFLTKIDTREEGEIREVEEYLAKNFKEQLGLEPLIFPVSAKNGLLGKAAKDPALLQKSRLQEVERFIRERVGPTRLSKTLPFQIALAMLTYFLVNLTWVFFRARDFDTAWRMIGSMLTFGHGEHVLPGVDVLLVGGTILAILFVHGLMRERRLEDVVARTPWWVTAAVVGGMLFAIIITQGSNDAFIYFQF